jgi:hypothetical protein
MSTSTDDQNINKHEHPLINGGREIFYKSENNKLPDLPLGKRDA